MWAHKIAANSGEEFVSTLLSLRFFGLDLARGVVLLERRAGRPFVPLGREKRRRVCRTSPPLPAASRRAEGEGPVTFKSGLGVGVYWFEQLGFFKRGLEWAVAANCRNRPPFFGWERAAGWAVAELLGEVSYWRFWSPLSGAVEGHLLIAGSSGSGKTTFLKRYLSWVGRWYVVDLTEGGEYVGLGPTVEGSIDLASLDAEEQALLYSLGVAATVGAKEAAVSAVQLGALKLVARRGLGLDGLLEELRAARDVPQLTREVLYAKLSAACAGFEDGRCKPHPALTKDAEIPPPPAVIRVDPANLLVAAVVAHGVLARLLREGGAFVAVDEYHKIAPRLPVEDPVERAIREGRHRRVSVAIATQNPLDLKESLVPVVGNYVFFRLAGPAARLAADVLNVPQWAVESLGTGEYLARLSHGPAAGAL
ncbi:ATP-binding protein [Pyrobaculum sp.]|uniref:ATP-binding protein n=1 Tax=Pyrobaculum sp. TaxID=2004705 RepID=UPI00317AFA0D